MDRLCKFSYELCERTKSWLTDDPNVVFVTMADAPNAKWGKFTRDLLGYWCVMDLRTWQFLTIDEVRQEENNWYFSSLSLSIGVSFEEYN